MGGAGSHRSGRGRLDPGPAGRPRGGERVGKATNAALAGRARTRQRALAAGAVDAERELRLTAAAADAHRALSAIEAARERAALAIAAARATGTRRGRRGRGTCSHAAVRRAAAERLTVAQVAELVGMPAPGVRRILRATAGPDEVSSADPAAGRSAAGWTGVSRAADRGGPAAA